MFHWKEITGAVVYLAAKVQLYHKKLFHSIAKFEEVDPPSIKDFRQRF